MEELKRMIAQARSDVEFFRAESRKPMSTGGPRNYTLTVDAAAAKIRLTALEDALRAIQRAERDTHRP